MGLWNNLKQFLGIGKKEASDGDVEQRPIDPPVPQQPTRVAREFGLTDAPAPLQAPPRDWPVPDQPERRPLTDVQAAEGLVQANAAWAQDTLPGGHNTSGMPYFDAPQIPKYPNPESGSTPDIAPYGQSLPTPRDDIPKIERKLPERTDPAEIKQNGMVRIPIEREGSESTGTLAQRYQDFMEQRGDPRNQTDSPGGGKDSSDMAQIIALLERIAAAVEGEKEEDDGPIQLLLSEIKQLGTVGP